MRLNSEAMFKRLKRALDEALEKIGVTEDDVDRLLGAMREELIDTKAQVPELERHLAGLEKEREREREKVQDCVRRATQAEEIGDSETMEVAVRFAEQHRARLHVLEQKVEATRSELAMKRREVAEMTEQLKEAMSQRDALAAQARRARTIENTRGSGRDAVDEFDRMADRMSRGVETSDAEEELDRELSGREDEPDWRDVERQFDRKEREANAEQLLEELKRRMGMEDDEA